MMHLRLSFRTINPPIHAIMMRGQACMTMTMSDCHAGLELFFIDAPGAAAGGGPTWGASSAFFTFGKEEERERAAAVLTGQPALGSSLPGGRRAAAAAGSILEACFGPWFASFCVSVVA